jgi:hypothetical protein
LGLTINGCTGEKPGDTAVTACLDYVTTSVCLTSSPCLDYGYTGESGDSGDSGDTGVGDTGLGDTGVGDTGVGDTGATSTRAARFERLAAEGVLPADVVERLRGR